MRDMQTGFFFFFTYLFIYFLSFFSHTLSKAKGNNDFLKQNSHHISTQVSLDKLERKSLRSVLGLRVVLYLGGELVQNIFVRGSVYSIEGCSEDFMYFRLVTILLHTWYFIFIYMMMMYVFFTYLYMCCFFSIFVHMFLYVRNHYLCLTHNALMSFV